MGELTLQDVARLTAEYGEGWGYAHACRVLQLVEQIGAGVEYDRASVAWAAYLHDWGAYPKYRQPGVDHALRSKQIAQEEILPQTELAPAAVAIVLEAIEMHDYRNHAPVQSNEALLLREADWLDMLGVIGILRAFASGPNDLRRCYEQVRARYEGIRERLTLPIAQALARERLAEMEFVFRQLETESFGHL